MKLDRPTRFPLSVRSTPTQLALGAAILGFVGGGPVFFGSLLPNFMTLVLGVLVAIWFFALVSLPFTLRRTRASDVVVDGEGARVVGGPHHGRTFRWAALAPPNAVRLDVRGEPPSFRLTLAGITVAESEVEAEGASLAALADSLATLARGWHEAQRPPSPRPLDPRVLECAGCGAPLAIPVAGDARCAFCGATRAVPEALARSVRDAAEIESRGRSTRAALVALERWRSARVVNALLAVALVPLALAWPVMAAFTSEYFQSYDLLSWTDVLALFFATGALSLGLILVVEAQLVLRRAFALVAATFHARPPARAGGAPECRACGAPLAVRAEAPLVVCGYCRSDNVVVGVLLPHTVAVERQQGDSLDQLLRHQLRARRRWRVAFIAALLLVAVGGHIASGALRRVRASSLPRHAPIDRRLSYRPPR